MVALAHERAFGVEIECGISGMCRRVSEVLGFGTFRDGYPIYEKGGWTIGSDGSGVELRTPPLQGEDGFEEIREVMAKLKAEGAYVTRLDGLHIHHDAPEFIDNPHACLQLVRSWR